MIKFLCFEKYKKYYFKGDYIVNKRKIIAGVITIFTVGVVIFLLIISSNLYSLGSEEETIDDSENTITISETEIYKIIENGTQTIAKNITEVISNAIAESRKKEIKISF